MKKKKIKGKKSYIYKKNIIINYLLKNKINENNFYYF